MLFATEKQAKSGCLSVGVILCGTLGFKPWGWTV